MAARILVRAIGVLVLLGGAMPAGAASVPPGQVIEIGPEANFCAVANALEPGERLVLRSGDYRGPCAIRRGGRADGRITIEGKEGEAPPRIVYRGRKANVIDVRADHVVIRGLEIGPTQPGVDGVRVYGGKDVTIERCRFTHLRGIGVVASHASVQGLVVRDNVMVDSHSTAMYFGCHDGRGCALSGAVVERNFIRTVRAPDPFVGYGIQVKLNSEAVIRDNVVVDTKGPGIMVFGARDADRKSVVEGNFVMGSLSSSGIVVGGGPALVRNNIAIGNREAGIALENYGWRGLLRGIAVVHNTVLANQRGGIAVPWWSGPDVVVVNNAAASSGWWAALPGWRPGLSVAGNVDCSREACFVDPDARDFSPRGRLVGRADGNLQWLPRGDFFGARRGTPATVGAVEGRAGPIVLGPKADSVSHGQEPSSGVGSPTVSHSPGGLPSLE